MGMPRACCHCTVTSSTMIRQINQPAAGQHLTRQMPSSRAIPSIREQSWSPTKLILLSGCSEVLLAGKESWTLFWVTLPSPVAGHASASAAVPSGIMTNAPHAEVPKYEFACVWMHDGLTCQKIFEAFQAHNTSHEYI